MGKRFIKNYKKRDRLTPIVTKNPYYSAESTKSTNNRRFSFDWGWNESEKTHEKKKKPQYVLRNKRTLKFIKKRLREPSYSSSQCMNLRAIKEKLESQINENVYDQRKLERYIKRTLDLIDSPQNPLPM
jgi:hypothetical protein